MSTSVLLTHVRRRAATAAACFRAFVVAEFWPVAIVGRQDSNGCRRTTFVPSCHAGQYTDGSKQPHTLAVLLLEFVCQILYGICLPK